MTGILIKPGFKGVKIYSNNCFPSCIVISFPSNENAGGPILKLLFELRTGAGIAEKLPVPVISTTKRIGSPSETRSESGIDRQENFPIAPRKESGLSIMGSSLTSILTRSDLTVRDSSRPNPKKGSLKKGLVKGEFPRDFTRTLMEVLNWICCCPAMAAVNPVGHEKTV